MRVGDGGVQRPVLPGEDEVPGPAERVDAAELPIGVSGAVVLVEAQEELRPGAEQPNRLREMRQDFKQGRLACRRVEPGQRRVRRRRLGGQPLKVAQVDRSEVLRRDARTTFRTLRA